MLETKNKEAKNKNFEIKFKFKPGKVQLAQGIVDKIARNEKGFSEISLNTILFKHLVGDWGELSELDKQFNEEALKKDNRLFSAYILGGIKVYVITESDRACTTVLLAEEY